METKVMLPGLSPRELVEKYVQLQTALIGWITESLVSVSFEVTNDETTRVRLVYYDTASEPERADLGGLEDSIRKALDGQIFIEWVFLAEGEDPLALAWPVFRLRQRRGN